MRQKWILLFIGIFFAAALSNAQEVKINNNLAVESDGTIRMDNDATVWNDLMVFPDAISKKGINDPDLDVFKGGTLLWWFDSGTEEEVFFTIQLPHSYKLGTDIHPHVHWTPKTTPAAGQKVVWGLEYTVSAIGETFPDPTTVTGSDVISSITNPAVDKHLITSLGSISGTGLGISSVLVCRLYRKAGDASDTFGNDAGLLGFDFHFQEDTQGSREEYLK